MRGLRGRRAPAHHERDCVHENGGPAAAAALSHPTSEGIRGERGWRALRVAGAVPFATVGLLADLLSPLAEAGISVFAVSTFDTDYVLAKEEDWALALDALRREGYSILFHPGGGPRA